jgi:hypothetical protein
VRAVLGLALFPGLALAEAPLTGAEFDAFTRGNTLEFRLEGRLWGRETYLPGQQVIWQGEGEGCLHGFWRAGDGGLICFAYPERAFEVTCGQFFAQGAGLGLRPQDALEGAPMAEVRPSDVPLFCDTPEAGA